MFERLRGRTKPVTEAMDYEVDRYLDVPKRIVMKSGERDTIFKSYLADREGEVLSLTEIAKDMRLSPAQASRILARLISNKEVIRHGTMHHYSYTIPTPEVRQRAPRRPRSEIKEAVLKYLTLKSGSTMTQEEIARGSGVTQPQASIAIKELVSEGLVVRSLPTSEGTLYEVNSSPNAHLQTDEDVQRSENEEMQKRNLELLSAIDSLVWQFVRETRVTDVLAFLTWLEINSGKGK